GYVGAPEKEVGYRLELDEIAGAAPDPAERPAPDRGLHVTAPVQLGGRHRGQEMRRDRRHVVGGVEELVGIGAPEPEDHPAVTFGADRFHVAEQAGGGGGEPGVERALEGE